MLTKLITIPAIFFGHGSPMNAIDNNKYTQSWVEIIKTFPKPKAIIAISAHWETDGTKITNNTTQKIIYDFNGFPKELYNITYNAQGDLELAENITKLIPEAKFDNSWGLDHGTWSILKHIYPKADIPIIQISIDIKKTTEEHFKLAKKLKNFRNDGVLIIGSGNIVHNLRMIKWSGNKDPYSWAKSFNSEVKTSIMTNDITKILSYQNIQGAKESVPTPEHFIPLIYILGLKNDNEKATFFSEGFEMGSLSMDSFIVK